MSAKLRTLDLSYFESKEADWIDAAELDDLKATLTPTQLEAYERHAGAWDAYRVTRVDDFMSQNFKDCLETMDYIADNPKEAEKKSLKYVTNLNDKFQRHMDDVYRGVKQDLLAIYRFRDIMMAQNNPPPSETPSDDTNELRIRFGMPSRACKHASWVHEILSRTTGYQCKSIDMLMKKDNTGKSWVSNEEDTQTWWKYYYRTLFQQHNKLLRELKKNIALKFPSTSLTDKPPTTKLLVRLLDEVLDDFANVELKHSYLAGEKSEELQEVTIQKFLKYRNQS